MRYYLDTEFIERGHEYPIELISIGLVREDGETFYAVCADGWDRDHASEWVKENVLPHLDHPPHGVGSTWYGALPRLAIRQALRAWIDADPAKPEFWGYYADYDWVVFCQLFGRMIDLPKGWPMFCRDVIQLCKDLGNPKLPKLPGTEHNALADALDIKAKHEWLLALKAGIEVATNTDIPTP